jgi:hypothetical protein
MMASYSQGEWELVDDSEVVVSGAVIARVMMPDDFPCLDRDADVDAVKDECDANARLIIAAPDLLTACRNMDAALGRYGYTINELFDHDETFIDARDAMTAAIAKAERQS